jgi:hypothetical protein
MMVGFECTVNLPSETAVAELLVLLVIEFSERRGFVALELGDGAVEHRPRLGCGPELLRQPRQGTSYQRDAHQPCHKHVLLHGVSPFDLWQS